MNRRGLLAATGCAVAPFLTGCFDDPGGDGGLLEVYRGPVPGDETSTSPEPPNATIVDASAERVRDIDPLQEGIRQAESTRSSVAEIEVTEREYETVARALSDVPWYERSAHDSSYMSGFYFRHEDDVYVAVLTPFCSDSWLRDTSGERSEYGWSDCYDRAEWGYDSDR